MAQIFNVSLNYAQLMHAAKSAHSAFTRSKAGTPYVSLTIFVNDVPDQYSNDVKVTLNSSKAKKQNEGTVYVGNGSTNSGSKKSSHKQTGAKEDDLPF
jgi:hypothetical protein